MTRQLLSQVPSEVSLYEVSLRDGLQNESITVPLPGKLRLLEALTASGLKRIEVTSFVSPRWIPQLADADDVVARLPDDATCWFSALCPNTRGLQRAVLSGIKEVAVFLSASETHNRKNINRSIDETVAVYKEVIAEALHRKIRVRAYISTVWGCPYEGNVALSRVASLSETLLAAGAYEVSLGDTIGIGTPRQTHEILSGLEGAVGLHKLAMHMHDTRGTALANIVVGLEMGLRTFDASVGGLGGCPYAPGAAGNVATEDLVFMLQGMGIQTGVDLERIIEAGKVAESVVGRKLPGKVLQAGARSLRA